MGLHRLPGTESLAVTHPRLGVGDHQALVDGPARRLAGAGPTAARNPARLPCAAEAVGGREKHRMVRPQPPPGQRLRAADQDRRDAPLCRHGAAHAPQIGKAHALKLLNSLLYELRLISSAWSAWATSGSRCAA